MRVFLAILLFVLWSAPVSAQRFVSIVFHDVQDDPRELGSDDIATARLVAFLDWLKGNGWTAISLDDVAAAGRGERELPEHAILLSFDDGYASIYTRVYPLLLAFRMPAVFALVGAWMDAPLNATVRYNDTDVPRSRFVSWEQAREMAASGLAEFASHGYGMHSGLLANPSGSKFPPAAAWAYDARTGRIETDEAMRARVRADLQRSRRLMQSHLGRVPRTLAWPFGRFSGPALAAARDAGFAFAMILEAEPADARRPLTISRYYPSRDPRLGPIAEALRFADPSPTVRRVVCLDAGPLADQDTLGRTIESVRRLGANTIVLAAAAPAVRADPAVFDAGRAALSFAAWQFRTRAGLTVFLRVDAATTDAAAMQSLIRVAPFNGVLLDNAGDLAASGPVRVAPYTWTIRAAREALDPKSLDTGGRHALALWYAAQALRPALQLALAAPIDSAPGDRRDAAGPGRFPAPAANWLLVSTDSANTGLLALAADLAARGWLAPDIGPRLALPLIANTGAGELRTAQTLGATAFAACPATLPATPEFAAAFSAATFPRLP